MDVDALHGLLSATLDPEEGVRKHAEVSLANAAGQPGFIVSVQRIILEPQVDVRVRVAAAIYLKNKVMVSWTSSKRAEAPAPISAEDKAVFRDNILQMLSQVTLQLRQILISVVNVVMDDNFTENWPKLLPSIKELLSQKNPSLVYTGFSVFLLLCRRYRYSSLKGFDDTFTEFFPALLSIAESMVDETDQLYGLILYDFTKIIKQAQARDLPTVTRSTEAATRLARLLLTLTLKQMPADVLALDPTEREYHAWSKTKKWATFDLLKIYVKYVAISTRLSDKAVQLAPFRKFYKENITPEVTNAFLQLLILWANNQAWIPQAATYNILSYLENSLDSKANWALIEPNVEGIVGQVIFPLLCPTAEDLELFEEEPVEWVHKSIDIYPDTPYVDVAAAYLLSKLVQRRKSTFPTIVQFVQHKVNQIKDDKSLASAVSKIGVLRILQTLSPLILTRSSPVKDEMESFLVEHVLPDFHSEHGILKARACQVVSAFANIEFKNRESLRDIYNVVIKCLYDKHLPVQVESALTLQALFEHDDVSAALAQHVKDIIQLLLDLTKKIDLDSLLRVMDDLVQLYPDEVTPFAVEMATQLRDQFLSLANELNEAGRVSADDYEYNTLAEDKTATGLGILKSLMSLQLSLQNQRQLIVELSNTVKPIFHAVYGHELSDFYTETFALHENTLFTLKEVPLDHWPLLQMALQALESVSFVDFMDATPVLENYINYGGEYIAQHPDILGLFVQVVGGLISGDEITADSDDRILALMLGIRMFETPALQNGVMDRYIEVIVNGTLNRMIVDKDKLSHGSKYAFHLVSLVLGAFLSNASITLNCLQARSMLQPFMVLWFQTLESFIRVDELKLQELAILSLLSLEGSELPQPVQSVLPRLMDILISTLKALPAAIKKRDELSQELDSGLLDDGLDYDDDEWAYEDGAEDGDDDDDDDVGGDAGDGKATGPKIVPSGHDESAAEFQPISFASETKFEFYDAEDFQEDLYTSSPLQDVDPYNSLRDAFNHIAAARPAQYQMLIGMLSEENKQVIQSSLAKATY